MARFVAISRMREVPMPPEVMKTAVPAVFPWQKQLQAKGKLEASHTFGDQAGGCLILNVASHEELQRVLMSHPLFPFITFEVHPVVPLEETEKAVKEMVSRLP
jgi:muconolactone delta-isomerase